MFVAPGTVHATKSDVALCGCATVLGLELARRRWVARGGGGDPDDMYTIAPWAVPAGSIGARLDHVITDNELYRGDNCYQAFFIWSGGSSRRRNASAAGAAQAAVPQMAETRSVSRCSTACRSRRRVAKLRSSYTLGGMCSRATCPSCNRPTYKGCGNHVEQVLGDVPPSERCQCAEERRQAKAARPKRSWFGSRSDANR